MLLSCVLVVVGLAVLTKAADAFVGGAARLSAALSVPAVVIGAVVVGFGTSAPEMVVSAVSASQDKTDIAIGNIIGSNVANVTLILGAAALMCTMTVKSQVLRREAPLAAGSVIAVAVLVQGGISRIEGIVLLLGLVGVLVLLLRGSGGVGDDPLTSEVAEFLDGEGDTSLLRLGLLTLAGLIGVIVGAQLAVVGATDIAERLDLGEGFVGLTLIAIGTSLPELVTSIAAARKDEEELIVGNLLGSNVFNSLGVGGIAGIVGPGPLDDPSLAGSGTVVMLGAMGLAVGAMITGRKVGRGEAALLVVAYLVAVPLLA